MKRADVRKRKKAVVEAALRGFENQPIEQKILLLEGMSLILPGNEGEAADQAAHYLKRSQDAQTTFFGLIGHCEQ